MSNSTPNADNANRMKQLVMLSAQHSLASVLKDAKQREKIGFLSKAGLSNDEIAELLDTTSATVRVELHALRQQPKKRNGKKAR